MTDLAITPELLARVQEAIDAAHGLPAACARCMPGDWAQWRLNLLGETGSTIGPGGQPTTTGTQVVRATCQHCGLLVQFDGQVLLGASHERA